MKARAHWTAALERFAHDELPGEDWRDVASAPGYRVSSLGRVQSTRPRNGRGARSAEPRVLQAKVGVCGRREVTVMEPEPNGGNGRRRVERRIGDLVAAAFIGPAPASDSRLRYLNGDGLDDRLENLTYGTWDEVFADHAARARREEAAGAPTHCPEGHRLADLYLQNYGNRLCRECSRATSADYYRKNGAVGNERARQRRIATREARGPRLSRCLDCGLDLVNFDSGGMLKRCDACRRAGKSRVDRLRRNHRPTTITCVDCATEFPDPGRSCIPKRCHPCRRAYKNAQRRASREKSAA